MKNPNIVNTLALFDSINVVGIANPNLKYLTPSGLPNLM